jgi:methylmalonyl-CoA mutase, N-terminal domain
VVVGVNRFQEEGTEAPTEVWRIDPDVERAQIERVRALRARRPAAPAAAALDAVEQAARGGANLLPVMVEAVLAWATLGELAGRLRRVFGEHRETLVV